MAPDSRLRESLSSDDDNVLSSNLQEPLLSPSLGPNEDSSADEERHVSRNVTLTLLYTWCVFAGRSIWSQSVLATFVYLLRDNDPKAVGYITAVMGLSQVRWRFCADGACHWQLFDSPPLLLQLLVSFPSGYLADSYRRDTLLKSASVIGLLAVAVTLLACWRAAYLDLVIALAVWGCFWGMANTSLGALFADSIRDGERSKYFTRRSILITLGNTSGPFASLTLFAILGDQWTIRDCAIVMAVGQAICIPAVLMLLFFRDEDAVANDAVVPEEINPLVTCQAEAVETGKALTPSASDLSLDTASEGSVDEDTTDSYCWCFPRQRIIPILVATADVGSGLGSGMSIRYFPIFFVENLKLGPVHVQLLYVLGPLLQATLMHVAQRLAKHHGRCQMAVAFKWTGITFMFGMILTYLLKLPTAVVCLVYILRTGFMNSTSALTRSVLMDNVPKEERGKWSALESVNMFSWSGSAVFGGVLVGYVGMLPLFGITAGIQFLATLALVALCRFDTEERSIGEQASPIEHRTAPSSPSSSYPP